jgi:hypothetical protein
MYEDYYMAQSGNGLPVFEGSRGQRGHGLGSMLSGLFRSAMPMLKRGLQIFGRHALRTGAQIANDVADGGNFGESARKRVGEGIKPFVSPGEFSMQSGSGKRKLRRKKKKIVKKIKFHDIFK